MKCFLKFPLHAALCLLAAVACAQPADTSDAAGSPPLSAASRQVMAAASPALALLPGLPRVGCPAVPSEPITLAQAVRFALCTHPLTRQSWAEIRSRTAMLDERRAAYFPQLEATLGLNRQNEHIAYQSGMVPDSDNASTRSNASLALSYLLFDFGRTRYRTEEAHALLAAARRMQTANTQQVFIDAIHAYYAVLTAQASAAAARESEQLARQSLDAATGRHQEGVGSLADQLQARTAYSQAVLKSVKARGELDDARGKLALLMGFQPGSPLAVTPETTQDAAPDAPGRPGEPGDPDKTPDTPATLEPLISDAIAHHPALRAARARVTAAEAHVSARRADYFPTVSLVGGLQYEGNRTGDTTQWFQQASRRDKYIGVQIRIPLFDGFTRGSQVDLARADLDNRSAELADTSLRLWRTAWSSYQSLRTATDNLAVSRSLLHDAQRSFEVARGRYRAGVGTLMELLQAQAALAEARLQRIAAVTDWRESRLRLAAALGTLDFDDLSSASFPSGPQTIG